MSVILLLNEGSVWMLALLHALAGAALWLNLKVSIDVVIAIKFMMVIKVGVFMTALVSKGIAVVTALGTLKGLINTTFSDRNV